MSATAHDLRVVRRVFLYPHEKRTNFTPVDNDILRAVSSDEAARVTDKMSKIYLRLLQIRRDSPFCQSDGVVCFPGEEKAGQWVTAFDQMVAYLGVAPATARKALEWLKQKGIIGYVCPKGYPVRIWLNRAASSIAPREGAEGRHLRAVPSPDTPAPGASALDTNADAPFFYDESASVPAFKESHGHEESFSSVNPRALVSAAESAPPGKPAAPTAQAAPRPNNPAGSGISGERADGSGALTEVKRLSTLMAEIERKVSGILPACASAVRAEVDDQLEFQFRKIRQFLHDKAVPQAARTGQQEAYKILRRFGAVAAESRTKSAVYTGASDTPAAAQPAAHHAHQTRLTREAALELAESIWRENERTGGAIEQTLSAYEWLWEAQQQFEPHELKLVKEAVFGHEVQSRLNRRRSESRQALKEAGMPGENADAFQAAPPPAGTSAEGSNRGSGNLGERNESSQFTPSDERAGRERRAQ
jgi:hypothetical protein